MSTELAELRRGESRIVRVEPCPPHYMHRPNEYYRLRGAARRLWESTFELAWSDSAAMKARIQAFHIIRRAASQMPTKPMETWERHGLGVVYEIRCPVCDGVFEHKGNFYEPRCSHCGAFLRKRKVANSTPEGGQSDPSTVVLGDRGAGEKDPKGAAAEESEGEKGGES